MLSVINFSIIFKWLNIAGFDGIDNFITNRALNNWPRKNTSGMYNMITWDQNDVSPWIFTTPTNSRFDNRYYEKNILNTDKVIKKRITEF